MSVPLAHYPALSAGPRGARAAVVLVDSDHGPARAGRDTGAGARVARADLPEAAREGWLADRPVTAAVDEADARSADARRRSRRAGRERHAPSVRQAAAHAHGARRPRAARRVRQRREPAARARRRPPPRDRRCASRSAPAARASSGSCSPNRCCSRAPAPRSARLLAWWGRGLLLDAAAVRQHVGRCSTCRSMPACSASPSRSTLATALLFGLAPALRATRVDLTAQFQGGTRLLGSRRRVRGSARR